MAHMAQPVVINGVQMHGCQALKALYGEFLPCICGCHLVRVAVKEGIVLTPQ